MISSVFCIASGADHAANIVRTLKDSGFSGNDISVLFPDQRATAIGAGGTARDTTRLLNGMGAIAIPGLGTFVAAGPLIATLSGAAVGNPGGGLAGPLIGMGVPEYEARRYEGKLRAGNALISLQCDNPDDVSEARRVFEDSGAQDTCATSEASAADKGTRPTYI